jgi:type I restriction enzyme S subunit
MNDIVEFPSINEFQSLPGRWTICTLFDLLTTSGIMTDGDWVETKDQDPNGEVRLIQLADIGDGIYLNRSDRFLTAKKAAALGCSFLAPKDLLIARMADPVGRACIFPGDSKRCVTAVDVCIFRSGHSNVDHRWLMHIINSPAIRNQMEFLAKGVTRKRISGGNLKRIEIPIAPANEQQRTADRIEELFSELDAGVASLKRAKALLKKYRQAVLKAAVTGELTRDWRERHKGEIRESGAELLQRILKARRAAWEAAELKKLRAKGKAPKDDRWKQKYQEPQPPDTTDLPALSEGWAWARIEQLGMVTGGLTKNPKRSLLPVVVPYLRVANVYANELRLDDVEEIGVTPGELERVLLEPGDLLVVEGNGSIEQIGRVAIWDGSIDRCAHQNHLIKVRLVEKKLAEFAVCWLLSSAGRQMVEQVASSTSGLHTLSISKVEALCVPLPPISELEHALDEVQAALSNFQNAKAAIAVEMQRADAVRQSILKAAFAGRLVPQDPNDEPASVLLERIRAERAARPKPARGRRRTNPAPGRQLELTVR